MSIAQLPVAGEVQDCPAILVNIDQQAQTLWSCDNTNLPWIIFRAAFRAAHMHDLPRRAADLLAALARTVDRTQPNGRIFIHREKLTARARQSMRTLYRSLDDLEAAGLIERPAQERISEDYRFGRAYLYLTQCAIDRLGLNPNVTNVLPSTNEDDVAVVGRAIDEPSATVADATIKNYLSPGSQKRQPAGQVPADLQRLQSLGFHKFFIFKLMREARTQGKTLSDVVDVVWEHLKIAHNPICYLRKLLAKPVDFRYEADQRRQAREQAAEAAETARRAAETARSAAGKCYVSSDGKIRYTVSTDALMLTVVRMDERVPRVSTHGWQKAFLNAMESGDLIPAPDQAWNQNEGTSSDCNPGAKEECFAALKQLLPRLRVTRGPDSNFVSC